MGPAFSNALLLLGLQLVPQHLGRVRRGPRLICRARWNTHKVLTIIKYRQVEALRWRWHLGRQLVCHHLRGLLRCILLMQAGQGLRDLMERRVAREVLALVL